MFVGIAFDIGFSMFFCFGPKVTQLVVGQRRVGPLDGPCAARFLQTLQSHILIDFVWKLNRFWIDLGGCCLILDAFCRAAWIPKCAITRLKNMFCNWVEMQRIAAELQLRCESILEAIRVVLHLTRRSGCKYTCLYIFL